ncbi:MAG: preprotein translocase subunit SecG [Bacteroidales bacterium]|jgi:preprotein translocase subunit SecG|nr:preprotein translocase subunit SecG [Bacteroidales bacterium]
MYLFISILILILAILLVLIVLVQNSKGGGLASGFSSSNQIMGVRKTTDFLEKATWSLAAAVIALSIIGASVKSPTKSSSREPEVKVNTQESLMVDPNLNIPNLTNPASQENSPQ